jgi:hypothetical protein
VQASNEDSGVSAQRYLQTAWRHSVAAGQLQDHSAAAGRQLRHLQERTHTCWTPKTSEKLSRYLFPAAVKVLDPAVMTRADSKRAATPAVVACCGVCCCTATSADVLQHLRQYLTTFRCVWRILEDSNRSSMEVDETLATHKWPQRTDINTTAEARVPFEADSK